MTVKFRFIGPHISDPVPVLQLAIHPLKGDQVTHEGRRYDVTSVTFYLDEGYTLVECVFVGNDG